MTSPDLEHTCLYLFSKRSYKRGKIDTPFCRVKPGLHVRRRHKHTHKHKNKKPTCKPVQRKHKRLVLMLASSRFTRTTQRHKHKHKAQENGTISILLCLCLRRMCKPGRRKQKHNRKERKLKNSDMLSAYILVTYALPFAKWRQRDCAKFLCLRLSPYVYAYHMCKHPCAYACVVRVNQALSFPKVLYSHTIATWHIDSQHFTKSHHVCNKKIKQIKVI